MKKFLTFLCVIAILFRLGASALADTPKAAAQPVPLSAELKQVVTGVRSLSVSNPGALELSGSEWLPVAAVNNTANSVFAAARKYGSGRVLALGKDDILNTDNIHTLDNLKFLKNSFIWLGGPKGKRIGYSTGHGEFIDGNALVGLNKELQSYKYTFSATSLTAKDLKGKDILIIGNAWRSLSPAEISAVQSFTANGGNLILAGLGWSYNDYNPGTSYPMDVLSEKFGVKWAKLPISDSKEMYKDSPVINLFFPNIKSPEEVLTEAMNYIKSMTEEHSADLPSVLQSNSAASSKYISSLMFIADSTSLGNTLEQKKYAFFKAMATKYPQYYSKEPVFDISLYSNMAWVREHFIRAWADSMPLTAITKSEIASIARITGPYKRIWNDFGIYIADNSSLNSAQTAQIYKMLSLIPTNMHSIRIISVAELLGNRPANIRDFTGAINGINIFKFSIGEVRENSFPADINEGIGDIFTLTIAHEVNHVIDANVINSNALLKNRKAELIKNAGNLPDNYLRSMFEDGFFTNAPQEFFASISNEWFTDSSKTVRLGLSRFDKSLPQPINQALFFAEVYSQGGSFTYFYNSDAFGNITRTQISLTRDDKKRIKSVTFDGYKYEFTLNSSGDVSSYKATKL